MNKQYALILKTGEAEIKALQNTSVSIREHLFPIIELTRGRKLPTKKGQTPPDEQYPFNSRLEKIKTIFANQVVGIDITSDENLMSKQINDLYNPANGYQNWIDFLLELKSENIFSEIIPSIVINGEDDNFEYNLLEQVRSLKKNFSFLIYRNDIVDENCYSDFDLLKEELNDINLLLIIDCAYVVQAAQHTYADKAIARINNLRKILPESTKYIISSTSFPNNINEIGNDSNDSFRVCEIDIYNKLISQLGSHNLIYSDYGSINPIRNDAIIMARGWIPRIDTPLFYEIYYYRKRRAKGITQYSSTYSEVARLVISDKRFPKHLSTNWGINQILNCANGDAPASNPAFWISVRMCIHIEQQVKRIYSI